MASNQVVGQWYFNDLLGYKGKLPSATFGHFYVKCLMDIVAADGVIKDEEREWVVGFAAISGKSRYIKRIIINWINKIGYPDEVLEEAKKYQPSNRKEGVEVLQADLDKDYVKLNRLSLVYNALHAAGADGDINKQEFQAIKTFSKKLGVTQEQIEKVQDLYNNDIKLRKKRAAVLTPKSLTTVLSQFKKDD